MINQKAKAARQSGSKRGYDVEQIKIISGGVWAEKEGGGDKPPDDEVPF